MFRRMLTAAGLVALGFSLGADPGFAADAAGPLFNHHADLDAALSKDKVSNLQLAWRVNTDAPVSHAPLVQDGRVYFADWNGTVYAADAASGKIVWQADALDQVKKEWPWHGFAGTGVLGDGRLYEASVEGEALALDPNSGDVIWRTRITDDPQAGSISRLAYHDGLVYIGLSSVEEPMDKKIQGFEPDFQGKILALHADSGKLAWQLPLVEPPKNGVAMWTSFALDPDSGTLYFTTGNNYTGESSKLSDSLVAVDATTGEIKWSRQTVQHDVWTAKRQLGPDYDFSGGPQLFQATVDGQQRLLVGAAQKSGVFSVFDAGSGEPAWTTTVGYGGVEGGMQGEVSIGDGRIFAWSNNGYHHTKPAEQVKASVKALDAATGSQIWVDDQAQPAALDAAGFLAGDVYFTPSLDGKVRAYSADGGKQLWAADAGGPITASLQVADGRLYASTGVPGMIGDWAKGKNGLVAFATSAGAKTTSQ